MGIYISRMTGVMKKVYDTVFVALIGYAGYKRGNKNGFTNVQR